MGGGGTRGHVPKSGAGLIVADWEFLHAEGIITVYLNHLIAAGGVFANTMYAIDSEALKDGDVGIANGCTQLGLTMWKVVQTLTNLRDELQGQADAFITKIDDIDQFFY